MGNVSGTPTATLRQALYNLLEGGSFRFDVKTRSLISEAEKALRATRPIAVHERAVGLFCYDKDEHAFLPVPEELGLDECGKPKPGCEYLFRQPASLVQLTA
jgi:hypothetical protein